MDRPELVIVGSGVAGLACALAAAPRPVLLVSKGPLRSGATPWAQGGIAAALAATDSVEAHAIDTYRTGAGYGDLSRIGALCGAAPNAIDWLMAQGVVFDREADGSLALAREGGHSCARVAHAGGDATGYHLSAVLASQVERSAHIRVLEGLSLAALGLDVHGRMAAIGLVDGTGQSRVLPCVELVLATGGYASLYARATTPPGQTGLPLALAAAAGARLADLEFVQFHPTALAIPTADRPLPLLTEALRGAGARLVDGEGSRFMAELHPDAELAPRDVVARAVERARLRSGAAYLDLRPVVAFAQRFPTVARTLQAAGLSDLSRVPVSPAAHYTIGGLEVDAAHRTTLAGLHAIGECARSGIHGANRLASNSLLEGVVFGRELGARLALTTAAQAQQASRWVQVAERQPGRALSDLLWHAAGVERNARQMRAALSQLGREPDSSLVNESTLVRAILKAALARSESLGTHFRTDAPALASAA